MPHLIYEVDPETGCWLWAGTINSSGYGTIWVGHNQGADAHRWLWEQERGPIPPGKVLDHLCRRRHCVRLEHLEPVTHNENLRRRKWGYRAARKTCPIGHDLFTCGRRTAEAGIVCLRCVGLK